MKILMETFYRRDSETGFGESRLGEVLAQLPALTAEGPWLAGGALRRMVKGEKGIESDLDFFFRDEEQFANWQEAVVGLGGRKVSETEHHVTYIIDLEVEVTKRVFEPGEGMVEQSVMEDVTVTVQGINFLYYATIEEVLGSFDFTICQLGYDGTDFHATDLALWDIGRNRLVLNKLTYGVSTMRRLLKYQKQGYFACSGCLGQILEAVASNPQLIELDVKYVD